jgi:hypothetical protein
VWGKVDVATDTTSTIGNEEEGGLACFRGTVFQINPSLSRSLPSPLWWWNQHQRQRFNRKLLSSMKELTVPLAGVSSGLEVADGSIAPRTWRKSPSVGHVLGAMDPSATSSPELTPASGTVSSFNPSIVSSADIILTLGRGEDSSMTGACG